MMLQNQDLGYLSSNWNHLQRRSRNNALLLLLVIALLAALAFAQDDPASFTTFTAPGAGTKSGQGTFGISINDSADVTGFYVNSGSYDKQTAVYHGFVRSASGTFTQFDVSGAGTKAGQGTNRQRSMQAVRWWGYSWIVRAWDTVL
jgi:hypothetical protein